MLELNGYTVLCAENAAKAIEIAVVHQGPIHLLLTDVISPAMNGRALAQRVAKLRPDIKVLFVSGYTENIIVHHGQLDAGTNFLEKPYTHEALNLKVREVFDQPK